MNRVALYDARWRKVKSILKGMSLIGGFAQAKTEHWILMTDNWNLIGHEWAVNMLKKHVVNGTTRHANLFAGPPGLGRRMLALRFAQALNCQTPLEAGVPCGQCRDCKQISHATPDLTVIQADPRAEH
jgi:hypothetical protein